MTHRITGIIPGRYRRRAKELEKELAERRVVENALRESEQKFRVLAETSPVAIIVYQGENNVYVNPEATRIIGYTEQDCLKMKFWEWTHHDFREQVKYYGLARQRGEPVPPQYEFKCVTKSGEEKWVVASAGRIDYKGAPAGIVSIFDITERKRMEEELQQAREELEKRVEERTAELRGANDLLQLEIAERKRVEEMLQENLKLLQTMVRNVPIILYAVDCNGVFTLSEGKGLGGMGLKPGEYVGRSVFDVFRSIPEYLENFRRALAGGAFMAPVHAGGNIYDAYHEPVIDDDGKYTGTVGVLVDVTEQRRTAETLRRSEERFRDLVESTCDWIWEVDCQGVYTYASPKVKDILGYDPQDIVGKMVFELMPAEEGERIRRIFDSIVASWTSFHSLENVNLHRDGHIVILETSGVPTVDAHGNLTGFRGIDRDITERKRMEEELRLAHEELEKRVIERTEQLQKTAEELRISEERYALAVQGSNDGIWDLNLVTGEAYHSPRWKRILGYEDNEIAGNFKEWESRIHPDDHQRVMEAHKAYVDGYIPSLEIEHRLRHKNGSYRWVVSRAVCVRDSHGNPYRMAGSLSDITERKKLEQQLLQSQKMESVGILAGGVAHDFNNLLTGISGYGEILLETVPKDDELSHDSIRNILDAADKAADLTRGLLAFSRKQLISPKRVHIDTLISNTGKLIQRIIGEDIEFSTQFSVENAVAKADPGQIEQVLMNLATNARDAMPHGGRLSITTSKVVIEEGSERMYDLPAPGNYALISVVDTGTGMDKKTLENIFEPFYSTKEVGKGTGLGLAIVHGIIKQHNGSILASSEPGKGTMFSIYLPLVKGHAVKEEIKITAQPPGGTETVLIAEDEITVATFMKKILERAGYKVILANDGEEGVRRFREHDDISVVLCDVIMPKKNGKEMRDEIKKIKPDIKVVFISGYSADIMQKKGMPEEGTEFITKPFKKEELLKRVRDILDRT